MKKRFNPYKNLMQDFLAIVPFLFLLLSLTSFSFHTEEVDLEFNKKIAPSDVEAILNEANAENNR